jgi:hypothetical protein
VPLWPCVGWLRIYSRGCLNFVELMKYRFRVLCDFGLDVLVPLFEAHNTCLDVLEGLRIMPSS